MKQLGLSCIGWPVIDYKNITEVINHFVLAKDIVNCIEIHSFPNAWLAEIANAARNKSINIYSMHLPKKLIYYPNYLQRYYQYIFKRIVSELQLEQLIVHPFDQITTQKEIVEFMDEINKLDTNVAIEITNSFALKQLRDYLISSQIGVTVDFSHYCRIFGEDMSHLKKLPISHIHLRGYLNNERYVRISDSLYLVLTFLDTIMEMGYCRKIILEYPYFDYNSAMEDIDILRHYLGDI